MRTKLKIIAKTLVSILFIGCASMNSNIKQEPLLSLDPSLPKPEEVGAIGK